jgi:hypothetical protein
MSQRCSKKIVRKISEKKLSERFPKKMSERCSKKLSEIFIKCTPESRHTCREALLPEIVIKINKKFHLIPFRDSISRPIAPVSSMVIEADTTRTRRQGPHSETCSYLLFHNLSATSCARLPNTMLTFILNLLFRYL